MRYKPLTGHNIMELWAFDTCNFRCGYCSLVTSGAVTRTEQLAPFRDVGYIDQLVAYFETNRPKGRPWALIVTGGEPFMMPNLDRLVAGLGAQGDCAAFYTNNSLSIDNVFARETCDYISYVECSFHPDWHMGKFQRQGFFDNVKALVDWNVPTLVRFVGAPAILDLLDELAYQSQAVGAGFLPTTLFDPIHPKGYAKDARQRLADSMNGFSSLLQLEGGMLVNDRPCDAGERLFAVRLHQGGDITPCISTGEPVMGNIFKGTLFATAEPNRCFKFDGLCTCDIHFQQHVVHGADDSGPFARVLAGERLASNRQYATWKTENGIETSDDIWAGQGVTTPAVSDLLRVAPKVR